MTLSIKEKVGYAAGDLACSTYWTIMSVFLMYFYTDVYGLTAATAGTMFLVTRLWDALNTPMFGILADRTHSRFGRFRPYLLYGAAPLGISLVAMLSTPDWGTAGRLLYAYATYLLFITFFTLVNIPYSSLLGVMTSHSKERNTLSAYRFLFAFAGAILVQLLFLPMAENIGSTVTIGFQRAGIVVAVICTLSLIYCFLNTHEHIGPEPRSRHHSIQTDLKDLTANIPWLILFAVSFLTMASIALRASMALYYFKYYLNKSGLAPIFLASGAAVTMIGIVFTNRLIKLFGKAKLFAGLLVCNSLLSIALFFAEPNQLGFIFSVHLGSMLVVGPAIVMIWAMYGDAADYSEWRTGRRATGLVFSAGVFAQKVGAALGSSIVGWALAYFHFRANTTQSPETLEGIRIIIAIFPALLTLVAATLICFYTLEPRVMEKIESTLRRRRAQQH